MRSWKSYSAKLPNTKRRVSKSSSLVEVEGTLDEALSNIGNAIALSKWEDIKKILE